MIVGRQLRMAWVGVVVVVLAAGAARAATDANDFKTEQDKVSYILGTKMVDSLKQQGIEVNVDTFLRGIRDALTGQKSPFSIEEQNKVMMALQQKVMAKVKAQQDQMKAQQEQQQTQAMEKLGKENEWKLKLTKPELMTFDPQKDYFWVMETNKGNIKIKLMPDVAPMHVTSTIFLTKKGFYDNVLFHRVIPGFMAQGGDPLGLGKAGPGYQYDGEIKPNVKFDRPLLLAMANAGPGTDGSQFFITFAPTPWLGRQAHHLRRGRGRTGHHQEAGSGRHRAGRQDEGRVEDRQSPHRRKGQGLSTPFGQTTIGRARIVIGPCPADSFGPDDPRPTSHAHAAVQHVQKTVGQDQDRSGNRRTRPESDPRRERCLERRDRDDIRGDVRGQSRNDRPQDQRLTCSKLTARATH